MAPLLLRSLVASWVIASSTVRAASLSVRQSNDTEQLDCPGYRATNVATTANGLTAQLTLAGTPCNVFGNDLEDLTLTVEYQTDNRLHVLIEDADQEVFQVPTSVFPRPSFNGVEAESSNLAFDYIEEPFSFTVTRKDTGDVLFDTSAASLIFEDQYVRLRTALPDNPTLYGTGEHTDPFMLNTSDYTRIVWNRDAYGTPAGTNLYSTDPIYFDHRGANGTHAVFLLNSNGMNYKIDDTDGQFLEYDLLGGVLDFYFLAGPSPAEVAQQYAEIAGTPAMMPYWGFGFHQCKYGYRDVYWVAEVVANYSAASIPLETMWTDIDYMYLRRVFTLDPARFPLTQVRELVSTLHDRQQHYIVMVDPAVAYQDYPAFNNGVDLDIFQKKNGSIYQGVVWPGVTAFPDWFHPNAQQYWNDEFSEFFSADTGVDIDALWIDMNDPSSFCNYPCTNAEEQARQMGNPPQPPAVRLGSPRPIPGFPADFQPQCKAQVTFNVNASTTYGENIVVFGNAVTIGGPNEDITNAAPLSADNYPVWGATVDMPANTVVTYQYVRTETDGSYVYESTNRTLTTGGCNSTQSVTNSITTSTPMNKLKARMISHVKTFARRSLAHLRPRAVGDMLGLPNRKLIDPPYDIGNTNGGLSNKTTDTDIVLANGMVNYDTHNLYGGQMSEASRIALLNRRPAVRPLVITRSTNFGSGAQVGKWTGDNLSTWQHYLWAIKEMLEFAALYQVPMVGSDVCGFGGDTNDLLCARWATAGAFQPFYRNHAQNDAIDQEFYRWPVVAEAARNAIEIRYKLLDYLYTAFYMQNQTGTPVVQPMFFHYPEDSNTYPLAYQFFYGPGVLVAPVTEENSTTTTFYLPDDVFYDYYTGEKIQGTGAEKTLTDVAYTTIPLYYKGGSIIAQRINSANTTTELRKQDFEIVIAPSASGTASGDLYLDDGDSLVQPGYSMIHFTYEASGRFTMTGDFGYDPGVHISKFTILGLTGANNSTSGNGSAPAYSSAQAGLSIDLTREYTAMVV